MSVLNEDEIEFIGVYESQADSQQVICTQHGDMSIGWVSHTFSVNGKPLPENEPWLVDITPFLVVEDPDLSRIESQIKKAKDKGCDLVIFVVHWGAEWEFFPWPEQLEEVYSPKSAPEKTVPIIYSLGNFTPVASTPYTVLSLVANLTLETGDFEGETRSFVTGLDITPVAFMGEQDGDQVYAAIAPLADLVRLPLNLVTRAYVTEIVEYADFVLGEDWRR